MVPKSSKPSTCLAVLGSGAVLGGGAVLGSGIHTPWGVRALVILPSPHHQNLL